MCSRRVANVNLSSYHASARDGCPSPLLAARNMQAAPTMEARDPPPSRKLPLSLKILSTAFVAVLIPVYWHHYGFADSFLWFSSLGLLIATAALWLESPRLASMQLVSIFLLEMMWIADFLAGLAFGEQLVGIAAYMFDDEKPLYVRGLSLFHAVLPFLLVWLVYRLGYDRRAWIIQTLFAWLVLLFCFFFTDPEKNINWVFGPSQTPQTLVPPGVYLTAQMIVLPLGIYWPTHLALQAIMPKAGERVASERGEIR